MTKKELDVFLSSDQDEFSKMRKVLSKTVCSMTGLLTCTLLENRGADTTNITESSLKAVRDSDIYIGVFGRKYSETAIEEYREAVKCRKPCLTYVKKVKIRDGGLSRFIDDDLRNEFKYSPFRGTKDLTAQVETDLKRFILETLRIGLDERAKKKDETIALIEKEEKAKPIVLGEKDPLARAESAFKQKNYIECLVMTTVALEISLRKALRTRNLDAEGKSLGELIQLGVKSLVLNPTEVNRLREVSHFRNVAVHQGDTPNRETTKWVLDTAKSIIYRLGSNDGLKSELERIGSGNLKLSREVEEFVERRKPRKDIETVFRSLIPEIEKMSSTIKWTIKETTISYKTTKPFVSVELRRTRMVLHLTLPKEPREKGVAYLRPVYRNMMHCHFIVRNLDQAESAMDLCKKAYNASLA
jgi:predicted transport protein